MCGLAGSFSLDIPAPSAAALVEGMTRQLRHRGPDDTGIHHDGAVTLGHTRLSIIDLSERGRQPLRNEDGSCLLVFNGEIYNHRRLRTSLQGRGHVFRSETDGEVILHLYEEQGPECVRYLEGMFAFALYDGRTRSLLLARDRIGEKPLYYTVVDGTFFFASELKCLWGLGGSRPTLCDAAIMSYFVHTQAPAPLSMVEGVSRLLPAHYLVVEAGRPGQPRRPPTPRPYWHVDYTRKVRQSIDRSAVELRRVLRETIDECSISDVEFGLTLSGGVDSSTILGLLEKPEGLRTFTLGRTSRAGDDPEFARARIMAERYRTTHAVFHFEQYGFDDFLQALRHFDEPVGIYDIVYNLYFLRFVSRSVKVILTGNGADEVFGGYRSYSAFVKSTAWLQWSLSMLPAASRRARIDDWLARDLNARNRANAAIIFSDRLTARAAAYDATGYLDAYRPLATYDTVLDARLFQDLMVGLNHSASLGDTTGMAWSLESRAPFLHRAVVEFAASLPTGHKVPIAGTARSTKRVLKRVAAEYLPGDLALAEKYGCGHFIDPFELMKTAWRDDVDALLREMPAAAREWFSPDKVSRLWGDFLRGGASPTARRLLLKLVIFLVWYRGAAGRFDESLRAGTHGTRQVPAAPAAR
jgi:asparagine synthase (glutamine-hydrolysing)